MPLPGRADHQPNRYDAEVNVSSYSRDEGYLVLPVMGPVGTPPKIIRVHAAIGHRVVQWSYKKRGTPPIMPSMINTPEDNDIFLGGDLSLPTPALGGDQNQLDYVAAGEYTYVQNVAGSGARIAGYAPQQGAVQGVSPMGKFQTGRHPYSSPSLTAAILAAQGNSQIGPILQGWPVVDGSTSADTPSIDFSDPNYSYYDTTISSLFFSESLIL